MISLARFDHQLMPTDYDSALQFLYGRLDYERAPTIPYQEEHLKLLRMERLLELIGDPQRGLAVIHVAGTKGKGSTATMVTAVLTAAGHTTGLYSSPHLNRAEERIRIDGQPCSVGQFVELVNAVKPAVLEMDRVAGTGKSEFGQPTYFEIMTAMSMLHFQQQSVDYGVFEVGLGGRLDSTNVCSPLITVITSISLDHTKQLGNTLASIATEKAGIIKPGIPVISGVREGEARVAIERIANRQQPVSPRLTMGEDFDFRYTVGSSHDCHFDYLPSGDSLGPELTRVQIGMLGAHQAANAALATTIVRTLKANGTAVSDGAVRRGLGIARCPARIEQISHDPPVILDVAHNVASIEALFSVLDECFGQRRRVIVFGTTRGKDVRGMLKRIVGSCDCLILTQYHDNPRSYPATKLAAWAFAVEKTGTRTTIHVQADPIQAWQLARNEAGNDKLVCVSGSFFLAAELRPLMLNQFGIASQ